MTDGGRAEEHNGKSVSTMELQDDIVAEIMSRLPLELQDDIVVEIISRLPLKLAVQCKVLSKNLKGRISEFSQALLQRQNNSSPQLIYSFNVFGKFYKISLNPVTPHEMTLSYVVEILASCNGLILFDFREIALFCVFNPITGVHQLIPYPGSPTEFSYIGLAVDYMSTDQYKLVAIHKLDKNSNLFYRFHVLSSEGSGLWHEIQLRTNTSISLSYGSPPVYWRDSLYWLRKDGSVLAFDTKKEEAMLIDRPELIDHYDLIYYKIFTGDDKWLGIAQGILTLVCIFKKSIVISAYNNASSGWSVSHTLDNFVSDLYGIVHGFPVWIHSKQVCFLVEHPLASYHSLYEYDTEINGYKIFSELDTVNYPMYYFYPTLASVHPSDNVNAAHLSYTAAKLENIRRFIIEGVSVEEEGDEEEEEEEEEEDEEEEEEEEEG